MRDHAVLKGLQRAELAQRTGCNLETVRYYEKVGLLPEPPRTTSGYRSYDTSHERRLRFVLRARELGFSLDEIRELLRLVDERDQPCAEARAVAAAHLEDVQAKIADLKRMERVLKKVVAQCADGTLPECPLIETLFQASPTSSAPSPSAAAGILDGRPRDPEVRRRSGRSERIVTPDKRRHRPAQQQKAD